MNTPLNIEQFQKGIDIYSNNNIVMHCPGLELSDSHDLSDRGIYVVNDSFKYLYAHNTLTKKEEIVAILSLIFQQARTYFAKEFENCINITKNIAESDNLIYDIENGKKGPTKVKRAKNN